MADHAATPSAQALSPVKNEPKPAEPMPTEPMPAEPKPVEPKPTESKPAEPKPAEPKRTNWNPNCSSDSDGSPKPESNRSKKRRRDANLGAGSKGFGSQGPKRRDMGRKDFERSSCDRRSRVEASRARAIEDGTAVPLPADDGEKEDRKPKKKVAVMIGYSGTGYKGMQLSPGLPTIEGDLFEAFVRAGAISKVNADDPKKSSLVRCARTDKGVHAAGNMISLKLIVEEPDIVERINKELSPQIRVWGITRTIGSFSCYQACDSRWYEYLIPSSAFLPPHPSSFLAKRLVESAVATNDTEAYQKRQEGVDHFWDDVDKTAIKPILDALDDDIRLAVVESLYKASADFDFSDKDEDAGSESGDAPGYIDGQQEPEPAVEAGSESISEPINASDETTNQKAVNPRTVFRKRVAEATRKVRLAYETAKRAFRLPPARRAAIQRALDLYVGTHNYHNYTVQKSFRDPSAKRNIKSFQLDPSPVYIPLGGGEAVDEDLPGATEWVSIKIHGQSFMMHQIRKMIGLSTLLVRCGADTERRIPESYTDQKWAIPKVPGLGLLLERPVFESYNLHTAPKHEREAVGFEKFETQIREFKKREIYKRMFEEEAKENT